MKKTEGYVIRKLEEEYVLLPTGKRAEEVNEVISLSETAGFIYLHAEEAASIPELAELVGREYGIEAAEVLPDVKAVVETLEKRVCSHSFRRKAVSLKQRGRTGSIQSQRKESRR